MKFDEENRIKGYMEAFNEYVAKLKQDEILSQDNEAIVKRHSECNYALWLQHYFPEYISAPKELDGWRREYLSVPFSHDDEACEALKQYEKYQDERDAAMYEQIPFRNGFVNGRRLNTRAVKFLNMEYFAMLNNTTVERMKQHWRCTK